MPSYIIRRVLRAVPQLVLISILAFVIIQLPPGDMVTQRLQSLRASGVEIDQRQAELLMRQYGLDKPFHMRYLLWIWKIVTRFDFGFSYTWQRPVADVIMVPVIAYSLRDR